ncbi:MAG: chemotaxis protein CheA [Atribacterota bacterium]
MVRLAETFDMERYLGVFLEEVEEHIERLEENLVQLEKSPDDESLVQAIFRSFHTIKGSSSSMGFQRMMELAHLMENLLDGVRKKTIAVTPELVDTLLRGVDLLKFMRNGIALEGKEPEVETGEIVGMLQNFLGKREKVEKKEVAEEPKVEEEQREVPREEREYAVRVFLTLDCSMKGVRAYLVINRLQESGIEVVSTNPSLTDLESERFGQSFDVFVRSELGPEDIKKIVESVAEVEKAEVTVQEREVQEEASREEKKEETQVRAPSQERKKVTGGLKKTVRVDVERLDALMNLVGELVIDRARLEDIIRKLQESREVAHLRTLLADTTTHIGRVTNELQMEIMKARMLPLAEVFNRFPRMVRDLARNFGKEIDFVVEGEDTELDRSLIEEITDPLIHLLRNAVDHGIEPPEERIALGKPPRGRILLKAYQEENSVVILVQDDGRGIDVEKIRKKALALGLVTQEELARMSDREAIEFIFYSGFSTNEKVTDVSGRGVGMDIVRRNIERVNGQVHVESERGKGTTFFLRLPLTLAIIRALLVRVNGAIYSIPLADVVEIEKIEKKNTYWVNKTLTSLFRGKTLPLLRLRDLLEGKKAEYEEGMEIPDVLYTVVVNTARVLAGLVVDEIVGEQEIVIKSLGSYIGDVRGLGGATILGDGRVSLIVDVASLLWKMVQVGG